MKANGSPKAKVADELLARMRDAASGRTGQVETRIHRSIVLVLVASLRTMVSEINRLEAEIAAALTAHPDGPVFRSFFASSTSVLCPATLLAEIGNSRARDLHRAAISAQAGGSPVADESGKRKGAQFRWACNHRLRDALQTLANSMTMEPGGC